MKRRILVLSCAALVLAGGFAFWYARQSDDVAPVFSGNVDIREVNLAFRVAGRVTEVLVEEGDKVAPGGAIAKLDPEPLTKALAYAEGELATAEATEALLRAGVRAEDVARLKAQMEGAAATVANARITLERQQNLLTVNASSRQARDNALASYDEAKAAHESARQTYIAARNGARPEELDQAAAQSRAALARRDSAKLQLDDAVLTTPSAGTVLTRAVEPGAMVNTGTSVVTLSLDRPVRIRAYVPEPDLGRVAPGTKVLVYSDSRPGKPYEGVVGFVSSRAEFTPKQVETQDLRTALVYRIRVLIEDADDILRQGMPVTVRLAAQPGS
ncbi:MAG: HlyD family efflux transporter periplasmic adaptor subunit [Rhodospirillaceae bacterium]|nr:HlyD family efflux transporter periplasmic adaptor subunit [Rhodospirillaceae bacterium]